MKKYLQIAAVLGCIAGCYFYSQSYISPENILINKCKQAGEKDCECTVRAMKSILTKEQFQKMADAKSAQEVRIVMMSLDFSQLLKIGYIEEVCNENSN